MSGVTTRTVAADEADLRLDRWFKRHFPDLGHGRLEKLLRTGQVRVDGARAKAGQRLDAGQVVRVPPLGEGKPATPRPARPKVSEKDAEAIRSAILHMDDAVIAINKPQGLAVQGGTGQTRHLDAMLDALQFDAPERPRLVHRLDKDTSGVLLLARSASTAAALAAAFRGRETRKLYWAVVVGIPPLAQGKIDLPLSKEEGRGGERVIPDEAGGKKATTYYRIVERAGRSAAWLEMEPKTGRTHQLRVHAAAMGTPILGDGKYGGQEAFLGGGDFGRTLHLHARGVCVPHPNGGVLDVAAPIPEAMRRTFAFLGFDPETPPLYLDFS